MLGEIRERIKDYAKDIRLNLGVILTEEGAPGLSQSQRLGLALSCAYACGSSELVQALLYETEGLVSPEAVEAARAAACIMAMNNVYYRSMHMLEDEEIAKMPAKLRMNVIGNPGVGKLDFEVYCLGVSAIAGCAVCIKSHAQSLKREGLAAEGVQSVIRIAATIRAACTALEIPRLLG